MDAQIKQNAEEVFQNAFQEIVKLYTHYALLLNSFDVTRLEYASRTNVTLSTTFNIPAQLRLPVEVDIQLDKAALLDEYSNKLVLNFCRLFIVELVSHVDAWLEDIYESSLPFVHANLSARDIEKKVKSAWSLGPGDISLIRNFFISELQLLKPNGLITTPDMLFDRYEEMREIRHALIHTQGKLSAKHVAKLTALKTRFLAMNLPAGATTVSDGLLPSGIVVDSEVIISATQLLALRKWCFDTISYLRNSFQIS